MPFSFPGAAAPCPHIRTAAILGDSFHFILYCRFLVGCANPSTPSRHIAGSCRAFPGRKRWCGAKKSVSCARYCRPGSSIPQLRSLPPSSKLFSKKKASKSLPGRKKVIPLQPQTRSNGVIRPALRSEEEVIEKFTYQAASVRIQRKTNRQGLEEKIEE